MYIVTIPKGGDFTKANGLPFRRRRVDSKGDFIKIKDEKGNFKDVRDATGRVIGQEVELEDATYLVMLSDFLDSVFTIADAKCKENKELKPLKLEDSSYAVDIFRAIHVAKDTLELEKAPYEWLVRILETFGVEVFQINTAIMLEPLKKATEQAPGRAEEKRNKK